MLLIFYENNRTYRLRSHKRHENESQMILGMILCKTIKYDSLCYCLETSVTHIELLSRKCSLVIGKFVDFPVTELIFPV